MRKFFLFLVKYELTQEPMYRLCMFAILLMVLVSLRSRRCLWKFASKLVILPISSLLHHEIPTYCK